MGSQPIRLDTARLLLRRPAAVDAADVLQILSDPAVVAFNPSDLVTDPADVAALIDRWLRHWDEHGFGYWCVIERRTGRLVGNCGIRHMMVRGRPVLNLMYRFRPDTWGQGYATEVAAAVLDWVRARLPEDSIVLARIRPDHLASQRVAAKLGLRRDPDLDDLGEDGLDWAFTNRSSPGVAPSRSAVHLR